MATYKLIHGTLKAGKKTFTANKKDLKSNVLVEMDPKAAAALPKGLLELVETAKPVAPKADEKGGK